MNANAYLERIRYHGSLTPTAATLRELQVAHLLSVPFENLSIHAQEPILLNDEALFAKIVARKRGGFCYECNGLFAALLRALGFEVAMLSAEVAHAEGGFSPPFDHMTLMVTLDRRWLVDVGFGDSFLEPLLLDERSDQIQDSRAYRIVPDGNYLILSRRDKLSAPPASASDVLSEPPALAGSAQSEPPASAGGIADLWQPQYRFTLQPYQYEDFAGMCHYHQTSPQSHFTQGRICTRVTEDGGRITLSTAKGKTLSNMRLITTSRNGERHERILRSPEEYADALRSRFGVLIQSSETLDT